MTKHTPGPWKTRNQRWVVATRGEHEGEILIAPTYWMETAQDEAAANARLIASAPDLLTALQNLRLTAARYLPDYDEHSEIQAADAAIARATKESP